MNENPPTHEHGSLVDIVAIVTGESDDVLVLEDKGTFGLPHLRLKQEDFRSATPLNEAMAKEFGLMTTVLRCQFQSLSENRQTNDRVYVFEQQGATTAVEHGVWVRREDLKNLTMPSTADNEALSRWVAVGAGDGAQRCPWSVTGWWDEAIAWMEGQLDSSDMSPAGPPEQLRAWSLSSVIRMPTSAGDVYFKAVPPFMAHEGATMAAVAEAHPSMVPPPLAVDESRGWLLMPDFHGKSLLEVQDIARWEEAVNIHASMQVEQAERTQSWLELGCPDRSLGRMVELIDPLITVSTRMLSGRPDGLSDDECQALHGLGMRLKFMCARLADFNIPHSLVHGDLGGNILLKDGGDFVFFDWTDVCVSHPFFDMTTMAHTVFDDSPFQGDEDIAERLRDAYLKPWIRHQAGAASEERLLQAYEVARPLGALHQAMSYMWILMNVAEDARWELEGGLRQWLKTLLGLCGG